MRKGINTLIKETKDNIAKSINEGLASGLPIAVIHLMVDGIMLEINSTLNNALKQEADKYNEQLNLQNEQVEWVSDSPKKSVDNVEK